MKTFAHRFRFPTYPLPPPNKQTPQLLPHLLLLYGDPRQERNNKTQQQENTKSSKVGTPPHTLQSLGSKRKTRKTLYKRCIMESGDKTASSVVGTGWMEPGDVHSVCNLKDPHACLRRRSSGPEGGGGGGVVCKSVYVNRRLALTVEGSCPAHRHGLGLWRTRQGQGRPRTLRRPDLPTKKSISCGREGAREPRKLDDLAMVLFLFCFLCQRSKRAIRTVSKYTACKHSGIPFLGHAPYSC